jgi:hypothetical protein
MAIKLMYFWSVMATRLTTNCSVINILLFRDGYQTAAGSLNLNLRLGDRLTLELAEGGIYEPLTSSRGYSIFSAHRIG